MRRLLDLLLITMKCTKETIVSNQRKKQYKNVYFLLLVVLVVWLIQQYNVNQHCEYKEFYQHYLDFCIFLLFLMKKRRRKIK